MTLIDNPERECPVCGKRKITKIPAHHLMPGTVLNGKYIVGGVIGEGGFGITYVGHDTTLDMKVAVKEFYPNGIVTRNNTVAAPVEVIDSEDNLTAFSQGKEKFLLEARTLAKLTGEPGIVSVRDFFEENNTAYIVMEFLNGITLKKYLDQNGKLSVEQTLTLMKPVMQSLQKIHTHGLIHRDVSPDNIMITKNSVKLLDFGAARSYAASNGYSILLKPGYAPEEQYRSKGEQGPWSDVYAVCAVIYKCITGITPDDSNQRVYYDELKKPSDLGVQIDRKIEAALMKGLAVSRADRYKSIEELVNGLNGNDLQNSETSDFQKTAYADSPQTEYVQTQPQAAQQNNTPVNISKVNSNNFNPYNSTDTAAPLPQIPYNPQQIPQYPQPPYNMGGNRAAQASRKTYRTGIIAAAVIVVAALIIGVAALNKKPSTAAVGDSDLNSSELNSSDLTASDFNTEETILSLYAENISASDIQELSKMSKLEAVNFNTCTFEPSALEYIGQLPDTVTTLNIIDCIGVTDISSISELSNVRWLSLQNCGITDDMLSSVDFSKLTSLAFFDLTYNPELSDISCLADLQNPIESFRFDYTAVTDFSAISDLSVRALSAEGNGIADLSTILSQDIEDLYLNDNEISDISSLSCLPTLSILELANNRISDISPLGKGEYLTNIDLSGNSISDISPLAKCTRLYSVELGDNEITSLTPLSSFRSIYCIDVSSNKLTNLDGLEQDIELSILYAKDNDITDINGLSNCTVLTSVELQNNKLTDISVLSKSAATLGTLRLSGNMISDISPLGNTPELEELTLDDNKVTTLDALSESVNLERISAENNKITSIDGLSNCHSLSFINLANNEIKDMTPISGLVPGEIFDYGLIDLHGNNISEIKLSSEKEYDALCLHDNAITDFTPIQNFEISTVYLDYNDSTDWTAFNNGTFTHYCIVNCPLDKQLKVEDELGYSASVTFCTTEQANAEIEEVKSSALGEDSDTDTDSAAD